MKAQLERWREVCEQIAVEQDPERFTTLVDELNELLEAKEQRLGNVSQPDRASSKHA